MSFNLKLVLLNTFMHKYDKLCLLKNFEQNGHFHAVCIFFSDVCS